MTPKEKAEELVEQFTFRCEECNYDWNAKQCALIAVDELIDNYEEKYKYCLTKIYWEEVKHEIEKL